MKTPHIRNVAPLWPLAAAALIASIAACSLLEPRPGSSAPGPAPATPAATPAPAASPAPAPSPSPPPPVQALALDEAIVAAANDLFLKAELPVAGPGVPVKQPVVIDPLVDGVSGFQSNATRSIEGRIVELVRTQYPRFEVQRFSASSVAKSPIVLVGTFTGISSKGLVNVPRDAFRICLALADLKTGKIVSKGRAFAKTDAIDVTPTAYFRDSPVWAKDPVVDGYIRTCQATKVGDPIDAAYRDRIMTATLISDAINSYNSGRPQESLDLWRVALRTPAGEQLRVYSGIYLASWKLGRRDDAALAFGRIVDYGLANKRLAVNFLFKPGSTAFWPDPQVSGPYTIWLKQIAVHVSQSNACLEITGHTSPTGPASLNYQLSLTRAEYIKQRLESEAPQLTKRTIASGKGSRENIFGTGSDDASDALDRRVEFKVLGC